MTILTYTITILSFSISAKADEHLIITTTDGGQLKDRILDSDFEDMTSLSIEGPVNAVDWEYLTSNSGVIAGVRSLDLSKAKLILDGSIYSKYGYGTGSMGQAKIWEYRFWPRDSVATRSDINGSTITEVWGKDLSGAFIYTSFEKVVLPENTQGVGERAFFSCPNLKEVVLCGTERYIGTEAFRNNGALEYLRLPASVDSIADYAFQINKNLKSIDLSHVTKLGVESFRGCGIEKIELAQGLEIIPKNCFYSCDSLKFISVPSSVKIISSGAFYHINKSYNTNALTEIVFHDGLEIIEGGNFWNGEITSVHLPKTLKKLGASFGGCKKLETVDIPDNLIDISSGAFSETPFIKNNVIEEDGVLYLGSIAFKLANKNVPDNLIIKEGTVSIADDIIPSSYQDLIKSIVFPSSLRRIGRSAFNNCTNLTSITLPEGLEEIGEEAFKANRFESLQFPSTLKIIEAGAFEADKYGDGYLTKVNIPESVEYIGENAFARNPIRTITLPENLKWIGYKAFGDDKHLVTITYNCINTAVNNNIYFSPPFAGSSCERLIIGNNVESLPDRIFSSMSSNIKEVVLPPSLRHIGIGVFSDHTSLVSVNLPEGLEIIEDLAFNRTSLSSVIFPESLKYIGAYAFFYTSLSSVIFSENLKYIGESAFAGTSLSELTIPSGISFIGHKAFGEIKTLDKVIYDCNHAEGVDYESFLATLGESVTSYDPACPFYESKCTDFIMSDDIEYMMPSLLNGAYITNLYIDLSNVSEFSGSLGTEHLEKVVFSPKMTQIPNKLLYRTDVLEVVLPPSLESIGDSAFYLCQNLKNVELPVTLKHIGNRAFHRATDAFGERLSLPPMLEYVGDYAFALNRNIYSVFIPDNVDFIGEGAFTFGYKDSWESKVNQNVDIISMTSSLPTSGKSPFYNDEYNLSCNKSWKLTTVSDEYLEDNNWRGFSSVNKLDELHCDPHDVFSPDFSKLFDNENFDIINADGIYVVSAYFEPLYDNRLKLYSHTVKNIADNLPGKTIKTHDLAADYHGLYLLLPEGSGKVEIEVDHEYGPIELLQGNGQKMTIGNRGSGIASMDYDLTEPTPLFIYRPEDSMNDYSIINSLKVIPEGAAVESVETDIKNSVIERFLIDGRRVANPEHGSVVVEHLSDGTTRKVIVK